MDTNVIIDVTTTQENRGNGPYLASLPTDSRISLATCVGGVVRVDCLCRRDRTSGAIWIRLSPGVSGTPVYCGVLANRRGSGVYSAACHAGISPGNPRQSYGRGDQTQSACIPLPARPGAWPRLFRSEANGRRRDVLGRGGRATGNLLRPVL